MGNNLLLLLLLLNLARLFLREEGRCHRGFSLVMHARQAWDHLTFVTAGSLFMAAQSSFSSHRCSFLFGAGGIVAGAGIESDLGNDVILDSPAFTQKTPTPPANQDWVNSSCAKEGRPSLWVLVIYSKQSKRQQKASHPSLSCLWEGTRFYVGLFFVCNRRSSRWKKTWRLVQ